MMWNSFVCPSLHDTESVGRSGITFNKMLFSEFFILCLCCLRSYCLSKKVVMTIKQRHSGQHLSMRVDTGDRHAVSKRVCNRHWPSQ